MFDIFLANIILTRYLNDLLLFPYEEMQQRTQSMIQIRLKLVFYNMNHILFYININFIKLSSTQTLT